MARRKKKLLDQIEMFEDGGLKDEGGSVDPVSGNDVPVGSTQQEVRDDIPAQLSEGEFVLPADVVRYIGLENLMELRNKAKQGLQQMEDMGQMGNSEEATMDDTAEMDVDIDALIDEFDPNDPETLKFNQGGMPTYSYQPPTNIYNPQTSYSSYPILNQPQQSTVGYTPQTTYTPQPMQYVSGSSFARQRPGGMVEQKQYIGPNGQLITITFIDGKPQQEIPAGFKLFTPEAPAVEAPTVEAPKPDDSGGGGDGPDTSQQEAEYEGYVSEMSQLAKLDEKIADQWSGSLHNPNNTKGFKDTFGNFVKAGGIVGALKSDYDLHSLVQEQAPSIAQKYGLDINDYKNTGLSSVFSTYNSDALARDAIVADAVSKSLNVDPTKLSRDAKNMFMEDELTTKELNDMLGRTSKTSTAKTSFADAARAGTYDDRGFEAYDSPTPKASVAGGFVDPTGNVMANGVVSDVTDAALKNAVNDIAAGNPNTNPGSYSITSVAKNGDINVDINSDGIADRRVTTTTNPNTGKTTTNSYNFNIDRDNDPSPSGGNGGYGPGDDPTGGTGSISSADYGTAAEAAAASNHAASMGYGQQIGNYGLL